MTCLVPKFCLAILFFCGNQCHGNTDDRFDQIKSKMEKFINGNGNCSSSSRYELFLPDDSVSQLPFFSATWHRKWHRNRTDVVQMRNMAFNRAMFYSYIMQKLDRSFSFQPDWTYMSMSSTADMHANEGIFNASAIFYDNNLHFPNWLTNVDFNSTIPLFGPKAYHSNVIDDTREARSGVVKDMGSGSNKNYTKEYYRMNPWYKLYLPDISPRYDSIRKYTYEVGIKYSNEPGKFANNDFTVYRFFGPAPATTNVIQTSSVMFTRPYFDCDTSNKWIVSAVSPIVDYMPRNSVWIHLRRPRFVGVSVIDIDFMKIDFNPCRLSLGNHRPNFLAGIDKCEKSSTVCEPVAGYGFKRGGYVCECKNGYHYPYSVKGPFNGSAIENATQDNRTNSFQCLKTEDTDSLYGEDNQTTTTTSKPSSLNKRSLEAVKDFILSETFYRWAGQKHSRAKRDSHFDEDGYGKMKEVFAKVKGMNQNTCRGVEKSVLSLPVEYTYGAEIKFDNQARTALRIAHFLSNHHQNVVPGEEFGIFKAGHRIHFDSLFGEVLANVMSDKTVLSSGVFYEPYSFENQDGSKREYFGPFAFSHQSKYYALDTAGYPTRYTDEHWYSAVSSRWQNDTSGLLKYKMESFIRSDKYGTDTIKHPHFPIVYFAPSVKQGVWSKPYFKCDGQIDDWVITYSVPFIGLDDQRRELKFKGVVTVDVPLKELDINQCPQPSNVANPFKNTALCDYTSTDCIPLPNFKFHSGAYKCTCKRGFEYPWTEGNGWYTGEMMEREYRSNTSNLFDRLKCRKKTVKPVSSSTAINPTPFIIMIMVSVAWMMKERL